MEVLGTDLLTESRVEIAGIVDQHINVADAAGAYAIGTFERKANDLLAQADAYRQLSSSLACDEVGGATQGS